MKRLLYGIILTFLMASSILVFNARVMGTQEYASGSSSLNAVINGDFETGNFSGWTVNGVCSISNTTVHSGSYAAYLSDATWDDYIVQNFAPMELPVDNGLILDAWINPTEVGGFFGQNHHSDILLTFYDSMTDQFLPLLYYSWSWATDDPYINKTEAWFTFPNWSTGGWNELQRDVTADLQSYYGQTNFTGVYLDSITIQYHYSNGSPGAFWADDVSISTPVINFPTPPVIIGVSRTPNTPNYDQDVAVSAWVYGADQCVLSYTTDGMSWNNASMNQEGNSFTAPIPAQPYNTTVQYEVYAYNSTIENWVESDTYSYVVAAAPLSVTITPSYVEMIIGQSQTFNSTVSGGTPPYTYQWYLDYSPVPNATSDSWTFTQTSYGSHTILLAVDSANASATAIATVSTPPAPPEVYFSVEPVAVAPLTNINASTNGLETPPAPSPLGQTFTVEIHLRNATVTNVPLGVGGVEVHFYFGNILNYCTPIGFTTMLGQQGSVFNGTAPSNILYIYNGFYDDAGNQISASPYTNATQYMVAAASTWTAGSWNSNDGLVAKITFQITGQPSQNMNQTDFYAPLQISFGALEDRYVNEISFIVSQGTLRIDSAPGSSLVGDLNGDGKVGLQDLVLMANAYGSKVGDPNWNPLADIAPPYGIISLTDLVTLALHYGQHSP